MPRILAAESEKQKNEWITILNEVIQDVKNQKVFYYF